MAAEDKEITLGAGKLLGLFFMLAATCGIFFAVGYSLGKTSAREQALQTQAAQTAAADPDLAKPERNGKPAAAADTSSAESGEPAKEQPPLTFYQSVKETPADDAKSDKLIKSSEPASSATANSAGKKGREAPPPALQAMEKPATVAKVAAPAPSTTGLPQASSSGTYLVQIAAVTHEEDAAALAGALRKKSYAAAVVPSPNGKDRLFHVVLGPYASLQDAEAMKLKLQGEGYSPIVKR
jgi:cell division septation protein DedD